MLKTDPVVKEKKDAKDYVYKNGHIKFENLTFKHYFVDETEQEAKNNNKIIEDGGL